MEQWNRLPTLGIAGGDLIRLVKAATGALQREIRFFGGAAGAFGNDVIDVKQRGLTDLRKPAVLAASPVTFEHPLAKRFGNRG